MAWRNLHLSRASRLSLAQSQLVCLIGDERHTFPLEDLATIIVDSPEVTLTSALLGACAEHGVALIVSDQRHIPASLTLPFHRHSKQTEVARLQSELSAAFRKRAWQIIVRSKIRNQASALDVIAADSADTLRAMARQVQSGDVSGVEARAARFYWSKLFADFKRDDDHDRRNAALNYGYAVVRAALARCLVAFGFLPCFGLQHDGVQNAFNLADDLIEPFRPFVDRLVARRAAEERWQPGSSLTLEDRRALAAVLDVDSVVDEDDVVLMRAAEITAESLSTAARQGDPGRLRLPTMMATANDFGEDDGMS
jgi:CRISP-associated protein Cas1